MVRERLLIKRKQSSIVEENRTDFVTESWRDDGLECVHNTEEAKTVHRCRIQI